MRQPPSRRPFLHATLLGLAALAGRPLLAQMPAEGPPPGGLTPDALRNGALPQGAPQAFTGGAQIQRKWLDVPYAHASRAQQLDIYLPNEGRGPFPVIIAVHGGAFAFGDKADGQLNGPFQAIQRGYGIVSINYRMSGEAPFPAAAHDVLDAIRYIRAHAVGYQLDPHRIALWGGSAGGNLVSWAGAASRQPETRVQAVVDWFGPIDFLQMDEQFQASGLGQPNHSAPDSPESRYLGAALAQVPDRVRAANPASYITPDIPPFLIQHGSLDPMVPTRQSEDFAAAIRRVAGPERVRLDILDGARHGGPQFEAAENIARVLDFLDGMMKRK